MRSLLPLFLAIVFLASACDKLENKPSNQVLNPDGSRTLPFQVAALGTKVRKIVAGNFFTCAMVDTALNESKVFCWGANESGQLGNGTVNPTPVPLPVANLLHVEDIVAGNSFACAIDSGAANRQLFCWGSNTTYQLGQGDGNNTNSPVPLPVKGPGADATFIGIDKVFASNYGRVCAVPRADTKAYCWGDSIQQIAQVQPGAGGAAPTTIYVAAHLTVTHPTEVVVTDPAARKWQGVTGMSLVQDDTCALAGGVAVCMGQLIQLIPSRNGVLLVGGDTSTCQVDETDQNQMTCWGVAPSTSATKATVFTVLFDNEINSASYFSGHLCANAQISGQVWCWGSNNKGQLGIGYPTTNPIVPTGRVQVQRLGAAIQVTTGLLHSCALLGDGTAWCWGANNKGQLGVGARRP